VRIPEVPGLVVERRADHGESGDGAWHARDADGAPVIVKWIAADTAVRTEQLITALDVARGRGVPVPRYRQPTIVDGRCVLVQDELPGVSGEPPALDDVLLACDRMRTIDAPHHVGDTWGATLVRSLVDGLDGWCVHESLLDHSDRTRALLAHARGVGAASDPSWFPTVDLMHGDLHPGNLLQVDGRLTGIIDWESGCAGDGDFDLAYYAFCARADELWPLVRSRTEPRVLRAYAAHIALRMVDWLIRFHDEPDVDGMIDRAERLVARAP